MNLHVHDKVLALTSDGDVSNRLVEGRVYCVAGVIVSEGGFVAFVRLAGFPEGYWFLPEDFVRLTLGSERP